MPLHMPLLHAAYEYAAFQDAVLVLFINNFVTFTFTGLTCRIRQVCKRLTSETRKVQICVLELWKETFSTKQSSPRSLRLHPLPGGRQPQWSPDVKTVRFVFPPTLLGFYSFVFLFSFTLLEPLGKISMSGHSACRA